MHPPPLILTVTDLTNALKLHVEPAFKQVCVRGEVTNYKLQTSGHHYFSLIDTGAQLSAILFKGNALQSMHCLKNGDTIIATGEISLYPPRGTYQLIVRHIAHIGLGEALLRLQALKKKLSDLGYFRAERKRTLPPDIRRIGLVTSPSGAVVHDIYTILCRRMGGFHLIINPVRVQGDGASIEIAKAIGEFSAFSLVDVVIVCRGGGSQEDLAAFNEEIVAKACFESKIPIISAVGHETDYTILDLVADLRAPTPSAAAELVSKERTEQKILLERYYQAVCTAIRSSISSVKEKLLLSSKRLLHVHPHKQIENRAIRLDDYRLRLEEAISRQIFIQKGLLNQLKRSLEQASPTAKLTQQGQTLSYYTKRLQERVTYSIIERRKRIADLSCHLHSLIQARLFAAKLHLQASKKAQLLLSICTKKIASYRDKITFYEGHLSALNPTKVLQRGYAIVFSENTNKVIRSVQEISPSDSVNIVLSDGTLRATIQEKVST